jgi:hypothetical protein
MFSSSDDVKQAVSRLDPSIFVSRYILEPVPKLFAEDLDGWIAWKTQLGERLDVDPRNIVLVGSACVGYSLAPHKMFREFSASSDIDCGIVSPYHFDVAWRHLRNLGSVGLTITPAQRNAVNSHRSSHVFQGTIAANKILPLLPFGEEWLRGLNEISSFAVTKDRPVKLRVYRDFDALRQYHALNLANLRDSLLTLTDDETEIQ